MAAAQREVIRLDRLDVHWDETRPGDSVETIENTLITSNQVPDLVTNSMIVVPENMAEKTEAQRARIFYQERFVYHILSTAIGA
jgi:hypothetical protein